MYGLWQAAMVDEGVIVDDWEDLYPAEQKAWRTVTQVIHHPRLVVWRCPECRLLSEDQGIQPHLPDCSLAGKLGVTLEPAYTGFPVRNDDQEDCPDCYGGRPKWAGTMPAPPCPTCDGTGKRSPDR